MTDAKEVVQNKIDATVNSEPFKEFLGGIGKVTTEAKGVKNLELFPVGKPVGFPKEIDQHQRIRNHLMSKMNIIDLIPCDYLLPLSKLMDVTNKNSETQVTEAMLPHLSYLDAVNEYSNACTANGLPGNYGGVRLFLTDETTSTDDFSNSYSDNLMQTVFNGLTDFSKQFKAWGRSITSTYDKAAGMVTTDLQDKIQSVASNMTDPNTGEKVGKLAKTMMDAIAIGNKIALPKIWSDSSYTPNVSAVVKLVSPYGHPDAIKEFIIKPLMHLLIIASAKTKDGITYGASTRLTIKGYGITHIPLGTIQSINLRKGGADTSYNIYRQPLSVDVSITFQSLVDGFAHYNEGEHAKDIFTNSNDFDKVSRDIKVGKQALFQTLGSVVDSLRPAMISKVSQEHNSSGLISSVSGGRTPVPGDGNHYSKQVVAGLTEKPPFISPSEMREKELVAVANKANITSNGQAENKRKPTHADVMRGVLIKPPVIG